MDIKSIIKNLINKTLFKLGIFLNIHPISKFEIELFKFKSLKKKKNLDYKTQKKIFSNIKLLPGPEIIKEWEEIVIEWENCNPEVFKRLEKFYLSREQYLAKMGFRNINIDFIDKSIFTGSFGMPFHFQVYQEAKQLNFHKANTLSLIDKKIKKYPKKWSITNNTLFNYVKNFFQIIDDKKLITNFEPLDKFLSTPINLAIPINKKYLMVEIAKNIVNTERYRKNITIPFLNLSESDQKESKKLLKNLGINIENEWFVTVHAREPGWAEKSFVKTEFFRNANIEDYNLSIDHIINSGGKVVRVGDKSMSKVKEKDGFIDYAHSKFKTEKLDVILAAKSKFCIASSSGFFSVACMFDVPIILTNTSHSIVYYRLKKNDFYVPSILKDKKTNKYLKLEKMMFPPYSMVNYNVEKKYKEWNLEYSKNSPEDILFATEEMIERLDKNDFNNLKPLQKKAKTIIELKQNIYSSENISAYGVFPEKFLAKHKDLI